jgi:hypothetical protein
MSQIAPLSRKDPDPEALEHSAAKVRVEKVERVRRRGMGKCMVVGGSGGEMVIAAWL